MQCRKLFLSTKEPSVVALSCTMRAEMGLNGVVLVFTEQLKNIEKKKKKALSLKFSPKIWCLSTEPQACVLIGCDTFLQQGL